MQLESGLVVLDAPQGLKMVARRYTLGGSGDNVHGLTLLFAHCIGSHKEQWEPTIAAVFSGQLAKPRHLRIREAWGFDWQNHGDSAVLNREALRSRPEGISVFEWTAAVQHFVRSPRMRGHRMVPLGHSAGAGMMMLTTNSLRLPQIPYAALVLIEPTMITSDLFFKYFDDRIATMEFTVEATSLRRDTWPGRQEALRWMSKRFPWNTWDPRVVKLLNLYGLQDGPEGTATLKCHRDQEAISYPDVDPHFQAMDALTRVCRVLPVHVIWGTSNDLVPEFIQDDLSDASQGRYIASVHKVDDAGHMVVQEKPEALAQAICSILETIDRSVPAPQAKF